MAPEDVEAELAPPADVIEAAREAVEVAAAVALAFISLLLLEAADMSLAGPVAEVNEIFSSSNSAGPEKSRTFLGRFPAAVKGMHVLKPLCYDKITTLMRATRS